MWNYQLSVLLSLACVLAVKAALGPTTANTCSKKVTYALTKSVLYKQAYRVKTYTWCWALPPRCTDYLIRYRDAYRSVYYTAQKTEYSCCRGYYHQSSRCIPICSPSCKNGGTCSAPNQCKCLLGFSGNLCDKTCSTGFYGTNCNTMCTCVLQHSTCQSSDGKCLCNPGYQSTDCSQKCTANVNYGPGCKETCKCQNNAICNHVSGACKCQAGYKGQYCEDKCPSGQSGLNCNQKCQCQHGVCDQQTGYCSKCNPGYKPTATGQGICGTKCDQGTWGQDCTGKCNCNGGECDHVNGKCTKCRPGYQGTRCTDLCTKGTFGQSCAKKCKCQHGGKCDPFTGACDCKDTGYKGTDCETRYCGNKDTYGPYCTERCLCVFKNTVTGDAKSCHSFTGVCSCKAGWKGRTCSIPCPLNFYGPNCDKECDCRNNAVCDPAHGKCYCQLGFKGVKCETACPTGKFGLGCAQNCMCYNDAACSPQTGVCTCVKGWSGHMCERTCPASTYGVNCTSKCSCEKQKGICDPRKGDCVCIPGYTGSKCKTKCAAGSYGFKCAQNCTCNSQNTGSCDGKTGVCRCKAQYSGLKCEHNCPSGKWGPNCAKSCDCNGNPCAKTSGACECKTPGKTGAKCNQDCPAGTFGLGCKQNCTKHCMLYGTDGSKCDPNDGTCPCKLGYQGYFCERTCPSGLYGRKCDTECKTKCPPIKVTNFNGTFRFEPVSCHPADGLCLCPLGWKGEQCQTSCGGTRFGFNCSQKCECNLLGSSGCRASSGRCICLSGYTGPKCDETCPLNTWGPDCEKKCDCNYEGTTPGQCRGDTGECYCKSGWKHPSTKYWWRCTEPCSIGTWGVKCIHRCPTCNRNSHCNRVTGKCDCSPGYVGKNCTEKCINRKYGKNCEQTCPENCKNCLFDAGCADGQVGPIPGPPDKLSTESLVGIVIGIILLIVLVVVLVLIFYFRRKITRLRHEKDVAVAFRNAAIDGQGEAQGLDNPMYTIDGNPMPKPMSKAALAGNGINIAQNELYNQGLDEKFDQLGPGEIDPYNPYDTVNHNVYDEAKEDPYDNGDKKPEDANKGEQPYAEPDSGYIPMDKGSTKQATVEAKNAGYVDPYSFSPPTSPTDGKPAEESPYHNAYDLHPANKRNMSAKPPVAKKPNIKPRTGGDIPPLPKPPVSPTKESPYSNAYEFDAKQETPAPPNKAPSVLNPDDMDDIMLEANGEVEGHYQTPQRDQYSAPPRVVRPVKATMDIQNDMDGIMNDAEA